MAENIHRYQQLADALDISVRRLESNCKLSRARIGAAISRDSAIREDIVAAILKRYPNVNRVWLLTGQGEMFIDPHTLRDGETEYKTSQISRLRAKFNAYLASLAMDKSGEDLKKQLRELDDTISDLEKETGAGG